MRTSAAVAAMLMSTTSAIDKVELEQISLGLFEGALDEEHLEDVDRCATVYAPNMVVNIETAVKDLELKSVSGVINGLDEMANAFTNMSKGLKICANAKNGDQIARIEELIETFKNPETLAIRVGHDILFNGVNLEQRIIKAVADYNAKSYKAFGLGMGAMLSEIAIGTQTGAQKLGDGEIDMDRVKMEQIALGLFEGALDEEHLEDVDTCATVDAPHAVGEIEAAVKDMSQKSVAGVISGLDEMAKAFGDMSLGLKTCANAKNANQIKKIEELVETFKNPETLAIHVGHDILFNGVDLEEHITNSIIAYDDGQWKEFGQGMGTMLSEIAIGTQTQAMLKQKETHVSEAAQIATGLLKGAVKAEINGSISACFKDGTVIFSDAKAVVTDIEAKSLQGVIKAAKDIYATVQEVKLASKDCSGIVADWQKLETIAWIMSNPVSLTYEVEKHMIFNGVDIHNRLTDSVAQYNLGNFEAFGEDLGGALAELIVGGAIEMEKNAENLFMF